MRVKLWLSLAACTFAAALAPLPANAGAAKPAPNPWLHNSALQKCVQDEGKRDSDAVIADCTTAIVSGKLNRIEMFNAYASRATAYWEKKNFDAMLADATAIVHIAPNNWQGFVLRGEAYQFLGKPEPAIAEYTKAVAVDKKEPSAYLLRGHLFANAGKYPEAKKDFETCSKLDPKDQECRSALEAVNGTAEQSQPQTPPASAGSNWSGPGIYYTLSTAGIVFPVEGPFSTEDECEAVRAKYRGDGDGESCEYLATDPGKNGN